MEQKTEASQAVDERALFEQWAKEACNMPPDAAINWHAVWTKAAWEAWQARAALKAQPAPTEAAQGEDSARLGADMLALLIREAGILNERGMAWLLNGESISLNLTNLLAIANMIEDRASAETGGVKS